MGYTHRLYITPLRGCSEFKTLVLVLMTMFVMLFQHVFPKIIS